MCKAIHFVRFLNDTTLIGFIVIYKVFSNISIHEIKRISLKLSVSAEDCILLMRLIREIYLATLSRRLNDVFDDIANPAFHTVDIYLGICFDACKLNQVWNDFLKNKYILWDENHASSNTNHGFINKQMCIRKFS